MPRWTRNFGSDFWSGENRTCATSSSLSVNHPLKVSPTSVTAWSVMPDRILTGSRVASPDAASKEPRHPEAEQPPVLQDSDSFVPQQFGH